MITCTMLHCSVNSAPCLHYRTVHVNFFFFQKTSAVDCFHSHCSREREQYFFLFFKKISLRLIKFTRTVISILFLIIFYLILLHAQKNHGNYSSCGMNFVCNGIVDSLMEQ
jgi:hypothetical protein